MSFAQRLVICDCVDANADEGGAQGYTNECGVTKSEVEAIYIEWQARDKPKRALVIVRPTVIFGPGNRGNVYILLEQIAVGVL